MECDSLAEFRVIPWPDMLPIILSALVGVVLIVSKLSRNISISMILRKYQIYRIILKTLVKI